jgi:hypothetical protein
VLDRATVSKCVRAILAAALIAPAVWPLDAWPFPLRIPVGGVVFAGAALALRVVRVDELTGIRDGIRARMRSGSDPGNDATPETVPGADPKQQSHDVRRAASYTMADRPSPAAPQRPPQSGRDDGVLE